jgi:hypothetical protein
LEGRKKAHSLSSARLIKANRRLAIPRFVNDCSSPLKFLPGISPTKTRTAESTVCVEASCVATEKTPSLRAAENDEMEVTASGAEALAGGEPLTRRLLGGLPFAGQKSGPLFFFVAEFKSRDPICSNLGPKSKNGGELSPSAVPLGHSIFFIVQTSP